MTITEKYGFKVSVDQFGKTVDPDYVDTAELPIIELFETACLDLVKENRPRYWMVELGAGQAYYSLLFKHIIGKSKTLNIMVEPDPSRVVMGENEFKLNNCYGVFYNSGIGTRWECANREFKTGTITLEEILSSRSLKGIDILHCDIDGSEMLMLEENRAIFENGRIEYAFIATHPPDYHVQCKTFFENMPYQLISDYPPGGSGDSWLVYRRK